MKANLKLSLVHRLCVLLHVAHLNLSAITELVAQGCIKTVAIIEIDLSPAPDVPLPIHKEFVIKGQIPRTLRQRRLI